MSDYRRTKAQMHADLNAARAWEAEVESHLPSAVISRTNSTTELDFYIPGLYIEAKEKRQKLTERWLLLSDVPERDHFVLDELSLRKALLHVPYSYFVLRDLPGGDRVFFASALDVAVSDRVRRNRVGKGKWILNLANYRPIPLAELYDAICSDVQAMAWKQSGCMSLGEVSQV